MSLYTQTDILLHARAHRGRALLKHRGRGENWRLRQCGVGYRTWYQADGYFVEISVRFFLFLTLLNQVFWLFCPVSARTSIILVFLREMLLYHSTMCNINQLYLHCRTAIVIFSIQDCWNRAIASKNGLCLFQEEEFLQIMMQYKKSRCVPCQRA